MRWFLLSLVLAAGVAASQEPALNKARKANESQRATDHDQRGSARLPLVIDIDPAARLNVKAESDPEKEHEKSFYEGLIAWSTVALAVFTLLLSGFTLGLMIFTYRLWGATNWLVERTEFTTKIQQRAYIYGGGPYGELRPEKAQYIGKTRNRASYFKEPWCMAVYNMGRTPGTIIKVEWGLIDFDRFPKNTSVNTILKNREKLLPGTVRPVEHANFICPPTDINGLYYRHVELPERKVGDVFFCRIDYEDIFGDSHWSTFKLRFTEDHSDPIEEGYANDYPKPPPRRAQRGGNPLLMGFSLPACHPPIV